MGSISEEETCEKLKGLIQRQVQMCKRNLEVMDSVRRGAQLAIEECQYQFRNRRWNCSTLDTLPVFGKVVTQGELGGHVPGVLLHGAMATAAVQGAAGEFCLLAPKRAAGESREQPSVGFWGTRVFPGHFSRALLTALGAAFPDPWQLLGASSPKPFSHPAVAHCMEAPAQGIQRAWTFYQDMLSSSRDLKSP